MSINIIDEKMTALANAIRAKTGITDTLSIDEMTAAVNDIELGGGGFIQAATFAEIDIAGAADGTMYKYAGATTKYLIYTNNTWQVFSDGGDLITSIDATAPAYNIGSTQYRTFAFADYPDTSKDMTISFTFMSGMAYTYSGISVSLGYIYYIKSDSTSDTVYNPGAWVVPAIGATYKNFSLLNTPSTAISLEAYLWLLCNGTFTEAYAPTAYTTTFTVSDTSDITATFASAGGKNFIPDSFVATIVGTGSSNSVCSVVAIGTTTATYTRTTSGTASSSGGTNTVTYGLGRIVIPNKTTTSSSYNLKKGTWRIVAWDSSAIQQTTVVEETNDAGGTTLNIM